MRISIINLSKRLSSEILVMHVKIIHNFLLCRRNKNKSPNLKIKRKRITVVNTDLKRD